MRLNLENKAIDQEESVIIEAAKHKFNLDIEMFRKMNALKFTTSPQQ